MGQTKERDKHHWKGPFRPLREKFRRDEDQQWEERYHGLYRTIDSREAYEAFRRIQRRRYALVLLLFGILAIYAVRDVWMQEHGLITDGDRLIAVERPAEGESDRSIETEVFLKNGEAVVREQKTLRIKATGEVAMASNEERREDPKETAARHLDQAVREINSGSDGAVVYLPDTLEDGSNVLWRRRTPLRFLWIAALLPAGWYLVYRSRFAQLERQEMEARASVIRELPEFINRLMLLMNAGIVLETAFARAAEGMTGEGYFSRQMQLLLDESRKSKQSMVPLFREYANRTGVLELERLAAIISDNADRGADLVEKLRRESSGLWFLRKKQSEEQGRLAETKMTLPLAILLLVLLMVTVAPALLEM